MSDEKIDVQAPDAPGVLSEAESTLMAAQAQSIRMRDERREAELKDAVAQKIAEHQIYQLKRFRLRGFIGGTLTLIGLTMFMLSFYIVQLYLKLIPHPEYIHAETVQGLITGAGVLLALIGFAGPALFNYLTLGSFYPKEAAILKKSAPAPESFHLDIRVDRDTIVAVEHTDDSTSNIPFGNPVAVTVRRLNREIADLGRRGTINLIIGIMTTVIGVAVLGYIVHATFGETGEFGWRSAVYTLLRLSIAIFIQTFAYFFLRLYKTSLEDIKYYQNEITNVEIKWMAFKAATDLKNEALIKQAADALLKTERNFLLKKGESTLALERERLEKNEVVELVKEALNAGVKLRGAK